MPWLKQLILVAKEEYNRRGQILSVEQPGLLILPGYNVCVWITNAEVRCSFWEDNFASHSDIIINIGRRISLRRLLNHPAWYAEARPVRGHVYYFERWKNTRFCAYLEKAPAGKLSLPKRKKAGSKGTSWNTCTPLLLKFKLIAITGFVYGILIKLLS